MDYDQSIALMLHCRKIEKTAVWTGLGWPLSIFLAPPKFVLLGWLVVFVVGIVAHWYREHYRKLAETIQHHEPEAK